MMHKKIIFNKNIKKSHLQSFWQNSFLRCILVFLQRVTYIKDITKAHNLELTSFSTRQVSMVVFSLLQIERNVKLALRVKNSHYSQKNTWLSTTMILF